MPVLDLTGLINNRVRAIRNFHEKVGAEFAVCGISGGVDSGVMAALLADALGTDRVIAPFIDVNSSASSWERAHDLMVELNLPVTGINASRACNDLMNECHAKSVPPLVGGDWTVDGSLRSCIRAPILRYMGRLKGTCIVHGTGNECEDRWTRFYQKGGDGEVDTNPLAMLSKGEIFQLAKALGLPKSIQEAEPEHDLWNNAHSQDEVELSEMAGVPLTYSRINQRTGRYSEVGTIEWISRMDDWGEIFKESYLEEGDMDDLIGHGCLHLGNGAIDLDPNEMRELINAARKIEASTRHKYNPNIPTLGSREELLYTGFITNGWPAEAPIRRTQ